MPENLKGSYCLEDLDIWEDNIKVGLKEIICGNGVDLVAEGLFVVNTLQHKRGDMC
jgi:hypothetical protein